MLRHALKYGLIIAFLMFLTRWMDYRLFSNVLSFEVYIGLIALLFTILGIWMGLKWTQKPLRTVGLDLNEKSEEEALKKLGISTREYDVLRLMALGHSNQEIADTLFISLNTVKTHVSNLLNKLQAKRRTQAVQHAKREGLLT